MRGSTCFVVGLCWLWAGQVACGGGGQGGTETENGVGGEGTGGTAGTSTGGTGGDDPAGGTGGSDTGGTGDGGIGGCPTIPAIQQTRFVERFPDGADVSGVVSKPNLSGGNQDVLWYEFWTLEVGHFDLGPGTNNVRLGECDQCLTLALNADEHMVGEKEFFPDSGSIDISATTFDGGDATTWKTVSVKHNDVVFREYDVETNTLVPDGDCYTMAQELVFE